MKEAFQKISEICKVFIVSNCQSDYLPAFFAKTGLEKYVSDTECYGNTRLSKGQNIRLIMERNHIENAIYVGDTKFDYDATTEAGIPFVFAAYGFGQVESPWREIREICDVIELL